MILADTSIWIAFLKGKSSAQLLGKILQDKKILCHPWVMGELMVGNLGPLRHEILQDLSRLPQSPSYEIDQLKGFIDRETLYGKGLSLVDLQLLFSCLAEDHQLWTHDLKLQRTAKKFRINFST